jgi:ketosteroid isomerase-like protein
MATMKAGFAYACALLGMIVAFSAPAFADDADLKKQVVEQNAAPYRESFNKQDVAGIVATYATGAIIVNPAGPHTDIAKFIEGAFKAGLNHIENEVDQVWPLGADTALAIGKWRATGKNQSGAPIEVAGHWTATYVREGGKWKVRMTSIIPHPPPPAK